MTTDAADKITETNRLAWNAERYNAWICAFGGVEAEAARIIAEPKRVLRRLSPYLGEIAGKRICSVQGSHGRIAVALARLNAEVLVIDFSEENRRFALDLATAAGVTIDYAVCDIMEAGLLEQAHSFDVLVLELGILHYHQDLDRFFMVMRKLAVDGGMLLVNEFHPFQRKLSWAEGPHDYFQTDLIEADVPNPDVAGASLGKCLYRFWTMGDILTAVIKAGFTIARLDEHPDWTDPAIPGSFTLVARA
ncbi:methyltransferase domain-containing protein [Rhizobium leguminosarum]|uniref:class I SAM-dependent methyltransferase n=1 Tax=Rhizobium leguminosarum TaxID=384 RepID=UPI001C974DAA|nr:methyltransferase domain-containing protein [Rhizobium leguminosarum]MBY5766699.1 methyltransferase domain-containing protein [Rhizobium leguminosarum]